MAAIPSGIPVLIIGAGPTGLTAALLLARCGVRSLVLDRAAAPLDIPRAIVLDDEGARSFQTFGASPESLTEIVVGDGTAYLGDAGNQIARVGAGAETYGFAKRHFISQPDMETGLRRLIADKPLCDLAFGHEVVGVEDGPGRALVSVAAPSGPLTIRAQYVIAADGGRSPMRERLGLTMEGSPYRQDWIVVDTMRDPDQSNCSRFYCSNQRPHVSVPSPKGGRRYEFMLLPGETHAAALEEDFVRGLVAPFRDLAPADVIRKTIYTFHARIASK